MNDKEYILDLVKRLIKYIGADSDSPSLKKTPERFLQTMKEICNGYEVDPKTFLETSFPYNGEKCNIQNTPVVLDKIPIKSICEHHLLPFVGFACIAYIPKKKIIGLSKIIRTVNALASRLQHQEKLTKEIGSILSENIQCDGVGVAMATEHFCMKMRGIQYDNIITKTYYFSGKFMHSKRLQEVCINSNALLFKNEK